MLIIGAGGLAKELVGEVYELAPDNTFFYDDTGSHSELTIFEKFSILKSEEEASRYFQQGDNRCILGIGKPLSRLKLYDKFRHIGGKIFSLVSPHAYIGTFGNSIDEGAVIMPGARISANIIIGKGVLISPNVTIGHDCRIGAFCELSPGVNISGNVTIGDFCSIGSGAVILPGIKLGNNVVIGAGAVVTKNMPDGVTALGVPARIREN